MGTLLDFAGDVNDGVEGQQGNNNDENKYKGINIDRIKTVKPGENEIPEFAPVMNKIMGNNVCVIPMHKDTLNTMKNIASEGLEEADKYVSTDDVLTAKVWRAMCKVRCGQVGVNIDDAGQKTTLNRA